MYLFPVDDLVPNLAFAIMSELAKTTMEQVPEFKPDIPSFTNSNFKIGVNNTICIATIEFKETGIPSGGQMEGNLFTQLNEKIGAARRYGDLKNIPEISEYFDWDRLIVVSEIMNGAVDWNLIVEDLIHWANEQPLPRAIKINEKRVRLALPSPPQYSLADVQSAMWVLECDQELVQGSAFDLEGYGTITNDHVVSGTKKLQAFRASDPTTKYSVRVIKQNSALDLAIIEILGASGQAQLKPASVEIGQMDHVAVCGFPNYRLGDSGILSPGIIVGTRKKSGVQRLLTNAGIVSGMSGGPALGKNSQVIGICVTGSDFIQDTRETEDQSIIPIEALDLLE